MPVRITKYTAMLPQIVTGPPESEGQLSGGNNSKLMTNSKVYALFAAVLIQTRALDLTDFIGTQCPVLGMLVTMFHLFRIDLHKHRRSLLLWLNIYFHLLCCAFPQLLLLVWSPVECSQCIYKLWQQSCKPVFKKHGWSLVRKVLHLFEDPRNFNCGLGRWRMSSDRWRQLNQTPFPAYWCITWWQVSGLRVVGLDSGEAFESLRIHWIIY